MHIIHKEEEKMETWANGDFNLDFIHFRHKPPLKTLSLLVVFHSITSVVLVASTYCTSIFFKYFFFWVWGQKSSPNNPHANCEAQAAHCCMRGPRNYGSACLTVRIIKRQKSHIIHENKGPFFQTNVQAIHITKRKSCS